MALVSRPKIDQWNRITISEIELHINGQSVFDKGAKAIPRIVFQQMILEQMNIHMHKYETELHTKFHYIQK